MRTTESIVSTKESYDLPSDWTTLSFEACAMMNMERKESIQQNLYKTTGRFPVIDQGNSLIAGYTDNESLIYKKNELPIILFGDHTRIFKYIDFPFATGADGTKLFRANDQVVDHRFLYFALLYLDIPSRGYSR